MEKGGGDLVTTVRYLPTTRISNDCCSARRAARLATQRALGVFLHYRVDVWIRASFMPGRSMEARIANRLTRPLWAGR